MSACSINQQVVTLSQARHLMLAYYQRHLLPKDAASKLLERIRQCSKARPPIYLVVPCPDHLVADPPLESHECWKLLEEGGCLFYEVAGVTRFDSVEAAEMDPWVKSLSL